MPERVSAACETVLSNAAESSAPEDLYYFAVLYPTSVDQTIMIFVRYFYNKVYVMEIRQKFGFGGFAKHRKTRVHYKIFMEYFKQFFSYVPA